MSDNVLLWPSKTQQSLSHDWKGVCVWLEAEVGDAVTRLELPEKSETVVRNSEAVSSCSGQHRQYTYTRTHAEREDPLLQI